MATSSAVFVSVSLNEYPYRTKKFAMRRKLCVASRNTRSDRHESAPDATQLPRRCIHRWSVVTSNCVDFGEVVTQRRQRAALTLGFLLQYVQMLGEQVAHRVRGLEFRGNFSGRESTY
jgi:hypothetical protein